MVVQSGPDTIKQKAVITAWPFEEGLTFGTQRRSGSGRLTPERESFISPDSVKGS